MAPNDDNDRIAITVRGLRKSYGSVLALCGIDLDVERGTVLGLLGPNGAGKTTLVRILATLLKPDGGSARVLGFDVERDAGALREQIGLAGQYAAVDENLTGLENLTMVGRLYGEPRRQAKARARELLERFGLNEAAGRPTKTYSGGMRRRLDLAAALVARPPVLFLDEPTTGLDPRSRLGLWEAIESRVAQGTTVLLTTQYLDEADRLADRIAVIDAGTLIAQGTSDELKDQIGGERLEVRLERRRHRRARGRGEGARADLIRGADCRGDARQAQRARAKRRDRRGGAPPGRRGGGHRRHRAAPADAGRGVPRPHRPCGGGLRRGRLGRGRSRRGVAGGRRQGGRPRRRSGLRARRGARSGAGGRHVRRAITDTLIIAERNLVRLPRAPELFVAFTIQPIMFVLLFRYVFGGAIVTPGYSYVDFLVPGIIVQNIAFGGFVTAIGLNEDVRKGLIDRFRSLPMARSAVLAGRTAADIATNLLSMVVLLVTGVIIGFSFHTSVLDAIAGIGLLLCFGYSFSWFFAWLGLLVKSSEAANSVGFIAVFPLTFISSAFVPVKSMPTVLREFANVNPFTIVVDAMRHLWLGAPAHSYVWGAVVWTCVIIAVFAPLAVRRYLVAAGR